MTNSSRSDEVLDMETLERFQIRDRNSLRRLLADMADKKIFITAHLGGGFSFTTLILAVEDDHLIFDISPDDAMNKRAVEAEKLDCITQLDRIRIQFRLHGVEFFTYQRYLTLRSPLPEYVIRLQRREYYRLPVPLSEPVTCRLPLSTPQGGTIALELRALNISNGGILLLAPAGRPVFEAGMSFEHCVIRLPGDGAPIETALKVRNVQQNIHTNGTTVQQVGCEFIGLPGKAMARIQRYLFKVERDRRALETAD